MSLSDTAMERDGPLRQEDARARELAQTLFDAPLILEAGAGTGKTTVLVCRVVAWCIGCGWERTQALVAADAPSAPPVTSLEPESLEPIARRVLEGVVALTFTEAAAAEMERRVEEAFRQLAQGQALPLGLHPASLPTAELRRARARALRCCLDSLEICTIHGFCRRLLGRHPLKAGLHPRFEVDADGNRRAEVVREQLEDLLRRSLDEEEEADLTALEGRGIDLRSLEAVLLPLSEMAPSGEALEFDPLAPERVRALGQRLLAGCDAFFGAEQGRLRAACSRSRAVQATLDEIEALRVRLRHELPDSVAGLDAFRSWLGSRWGPAQARRLGEWAARRFGAPSDRVLGVHAEGIAHQAGLLAARIQHCLGLDPPLLAAVHRVLRAQMRRLEAELRARGVESYGALLRDALGLLVADPRVCAEERVRVKQLLVDEFQDTDPIQCEIIARLSLEGPAQIRPGLFLVGDPKQSIYGWRNADLEAYETLIERVLGLGGKRCCLSLNYRSTRQILDEVERVVEPAMQYERGIQPGFQHLVPEVRPAEGACAACVEHWMSLEWDESKREAVDTSAARAVDLEARALARDLAERAQDPDFAWEQVGILLRGTGDLDVYLQALREAGIPFRIDRDRSFTKRREVLDARALVRSVLDPNDQLAQVATLRSAWVGVPDAAWIPLWRDGFPRELQRALQGSTAAADRIRALATRVAEELDAEAVPGLASVVGWKHNLIHAVSVLRALRRSFERDATDRFVQKLRSLTLFEAMEAARFLGPHRVRNLERFFRELRSELDAHPGDAAAALRWLRRDAEGERDTEGPPAAIPQERAVRVMTIHKAKGLDFEHVYVLQLHKGRSPRDPRPVEAEEVEGALEFRLFDGASRVTSLGFDRVASRRAAVERAERVRTLYVAMTRARRRLVLAGRWPLADRTSPATSPMRLLEAPRGAAARRALERLHWASDGQHCDGIDEDDARWVLLGLDAPAPARRARRVRPAALPKPSEVAEQARALARRRAEARERQSRPWGCAVSDWAHVAAPEPSGRAPGGAPLEGAPSAAALRGALVGTAVHRWLERFDWKAADPDQELRRRTREVQRFLDASLEKADREAAAERARELLAKLVGGPLWQRLCRVAPNVLARELPILIGPEEESPGPVGYFSGTIDLLYRDPEVAELVVADFKTDQIRGEEDLARRCRAYAPQAELYARAVQHALRLDSPPRMELWFLDAGTIETLSAGAVRSGS